MTEEYKKELLNYMLGKLEDKSSKNEPLVKQVSKINNDMEDFIKQYYPELGSRWDVSTLLTRGDYIICFIDDFFWGENIPMSKKGRWKKTFIVVMDKNYSPVKFIDSYSSGTLFNMFSNLNTDDDGAGNIYITDTIFNDDFTINRRRVLIINDFTLTDFEVRLLNSYDVPKYNNKIINIMQLTKNVSEGKYFMIYNDSDSSGGALEFVNNVGSENEWNFYPYAGNKNIIWSGFQKGVASWTDDKLNFKIFCDYEMSPNNNNNSIAFVTLKNSEGEVKTTIDDKSFNLPSECKNVGQMVRLVITGNKALLEAISTKPELDRTDYIIEYNLDTTHYSIRYAKEDYIDNVIDEHTYESSSDTFELFQVNGQLYFIRNYKYYRNTHNDDWSISNDEYFNNDLYLYQIFDDEVFEFYIKDLGQEKNTDYQLAISNLYNLYEFGLIFQKYIINIKEIFNNFNYNGYPSNSKNCLVPNSVELYSNSDLVFARNIHNISINDNFTISSVEIPNNYLNDIDLTCKNLISKTNLKMMDDKKTFNKNIYENVFLNFINSIQVINKTGNQHILNNLASSGLNSAVNTTNQYDKMKLYSKAILYYKDGTTKEITFEVKRLSELSADLFLAFKLDKYAEKIEFVSNDKTIVYHTIDLSNLGTEKTYSLKQRVEIDFERNYATANGSSISIQDSVYARFKEISIDGVLNQETTKGYQLFDESKLPSKTQNGVTLTNNNDGSFTIEGNDTLSGNFNYYYNYSHEETLKLLKAGDITISDNGVVGQTTIPYYLAQLRNSSGTIFEISSRVTNSYKKTITQEMLDDEATFLRIGFFGLKGTNITKKTIKPMLFQNGDGTFEKFTGGKPSPNPSYQQPIEVIEDSFDLVACNKNLFNKDTITNNARIDNKGNVYTDQNFFITDYIKVKPNTKYTGNTPFTNLYNRIAFYDINKVLLSLDNGKDVYTITTHQNTAYIRFGKQKEQLDTFQLEEGSTATEYDNHLETQVNIAIPENEFVGEIDNIRDQFRITYNEIADEYHLYLDKRIVKYVFNGNEDISVISNNRFKIGLHSIGLDDAIDRYTKVNCICNNFLSSSLSSISSKENAISVNGSNIYFRLSDTSTIDDLKPLILNSEVLYILSEPYTLDLGTIDMPFSYNPATNIFTTSTMQPNMRVTYCTNKEELEKEESDNYEYFK